MENLKHTYGTTQAELKEGRGKANMVCLLVHIDRIEIMLEGKGGE